jgi:predicted amidophosphoribosyltransferase
MCGTWLRDALSGLVDLLFPLHCGGCGTAGTPWCRECAGSLGRLTRVRRPLLDDGPPAYALGRYRGPARRAVLAYKESGQRHLAGPFGRHLATALRAIASETPVAPETSLSAEKPVESRPGEYHLVPAPSRTIAYRRRGGAHMTRVARRMLAELPGGAVSDCLVIARAAADSAGLTPDERVRNLSGRVLVRPARLPPPTARIVLLDDVITSGATAAACLRALADAGVRVAAVLSLTATAG